MPKVAYCIVHVNPSASNMGRLKCGCHIKTESRLKKNGLDIHTSSKGCKFHLAHANLGCKESKRLKKFSWSQCSYNSQKVAYLLVYFSSSTIANLGIKVRSIPGQKQWRWRDLWRSAHGVFQQAWSVHDQSPPVLDSMDLHCPQKVHPEIAGSTIKQGEYTSQKEKIIHASILVTTCRRYDY